MKELTITIQGKTPLLLDRFTDEEQMAASSGTRSSIATSARAAAGDCRVQALHQ